MDDEPINLQLLYRALGKEYEMLMATSGEEALEICRRESPDLVLLDIVMPGIDGLEVCQKIRSDEALQEIPVIFVTGRDTPNEETEALEAGAVDFISKPVNPAVVRARVRTHLTLKAQSDQLRELVFVDGLTGVANRRRFDEMLDIQWRNGARLGTELSLFLIDVDHFKQYNDHFGHQAGDECLRQVAQVLGRELRRSGDLVARYGGEEFACLSASLIGEAAMQAAENLRARVEEIGLPHPRSEAASVVTISIGLASGQPKELGRAEEFLSLVDARLYRAKTEGRNRVVAAG